MRCGKCGFTPATVETVKACYAGVANAHAHPYWEGPEYAMAVQAKERAEDESVAAFKAKRDQALNPKWADSDAGFHEVKDEGPFQPPSKAQVDYLMILQGDRVLPNGYEAVTEAEAWLMEKPTLSSTIELLKYCQKKDSGNQQKKWDNIPEGRYALLREFGTDNNPDSVWTFYQVDKPTEGRWKGYTFVKLLIGAPGSYRKESVGMSRAMSVLRAIDADPKQAMIDYGLQSGVCGRCSSPLTDPDSLARGLGPKCAAKSGWF